MVKAARRASQIINRAAQDIEHLRITPKKYNNDFVTEVDKAAEAAMSPVGYTAVRLQTPKAHRSLPAVLRQDQAVDAMSAANSGAEQGDPVALRDRLIVEMLYATGIRRSEVASLDLYAPQLLRGVLGSLLGGKK